MTFGTRGVIVGDGGSGKAPGRAPSGSVAVRRFWAEAYWDRRTSRSFAGHLALFEGFTAAKLRLRSRPEIDVLAV
jgi:hypothetical protein